MNKFIYFFIAAILIAGIFAFVSCRNKPAGDSSSSQVLTGGGSIPAGAVTDEKELRKAVGCRVSREGKTVISVRTSAYIGKDSGRLGICPMGVYLTADAADAACICSVHFDPSYDKEWFDGVYTFVLDDSMITPATYTMVLCDDDDSGGVIGEWIFDKRKSGSVEIGFVDSWLMGANESRKAKEYDSMNEEVRSWFDVNVPDESRVEFLFDGYCLEQPADANDNTDKYMLMICPEGDYSSFAEAYDACRAAGLEMTGTADNCPYLFPIWQSGIKKGRYSVVFGRRFGEKGIEIQFDAEKKSAARWKLDFSDVKCPALESRYAG